MIVCLVVLSVSERGGLEGCSDLGPGLMPELVVGGLGVFEVVSFVDALVDCLFRQQQVTGMKDEVAEAYEIGAFVRA